MIVKHNNPCGTAEQDTLAEAYRQALACDPVSAFGGVHGVQSSARRRDGRGSGQAVRRVRGCAGIRRRGAHGAGGKKNLRLMEIGADEPAAEAGLELKRISGGVLVQEPDVRDSATNPS